jgi:hypothetical protein
MPVTRPQYGRKPGPSVVAPDYRTRRAKEAKAAAEQARKTALDGALVASVLHTFIVS